MKKKKEAIYYNVLQVGYQGMGKSVNTYEIIKKNANKLFSQIFWITALQGVDQITKDIEKDGYNIQVFDDQQLKGGIVQKLIQYMLDRVKKDQQIEEELKSGKKVLTYEQQLIQKFKLKIPDEDLSEEEKQHREQQEKQKKQDIKEYKIMKNYIKHFLIFDDQNVNLGLIQQWVFLNRIFRHLKVYVIYNIQCVTILTKQLRETCQNEERLQTFHSQLRSNMTYEQFKMLYDYCTKEQYSYMKIIQKTLPIQFYKKDKLLNIKVQSKYSDQSSDE